MGALLAGGVETAKAQMYGYSMMGPGYGPGMMYGPDYGPQRYGPGVIGPGMMYGPGYGPYTCTAQTVRR